MRRSMRSALSPTAWLRAIRTIINAMQKNQRVAIENEKVGRPLLIQWANRSLISVILVLLLDPLRRGVIKKA
jgi:hypothetical protein